MLGSLLSTLAALIGVAGVVAQSYQPPRTPWGDPDLQGIWTSDDARSVPLERPEAFAGRRLLTDEEFAERKRRDDLTRAATRRGAGTFVGEVGTRTLRETSLVVEPADGRMPPLTPQAQARAEALAALRARLPESWEDRSLSDRCITRGILAVLPSIYGNGLQIVQSPGAVAISYEMIHETRLVPLDGRPHLGGAIRQYMGDSRGRWENGALVIETTNFTDRTTVGATPTSAGMRLVERLRRVGPDRIDYEAAIEDDRTWVRPWTVLVPLTTQPGYRILPYECHEGNRALPNILSAARSEERAIEEAREKGLPPPPPSAWQGNEGFLPPDPSIQR